MTISDDDIVKYTVVDLTHSSNDRGSGGNLWPYRSYHDDGSNLVSGSGRDAKRGRLRTKRGCCTACQPCSCACNMPMENCCKPAPIKVTVQFAFDYDSSWIDSDLRPAVDQVIRNLSIPMTISVECPKSWNGVYSFCQYAGSGYKEDDIPTGAPCYGSGKYTSTYASAGPLYLDVYPLDTSMAYWQGIVSIGAASYATNDEYGCIQVSASGPSQGFTGVGFDCSTHTDTTTWTSNPGDESFFVNLSTSSGYSAEYPLGPPSSVSIRIEWDEGIGSETPPDVISACITEGVLPKNPEWGKNHFIYEAIRAAKAAGPTQMACKNTSCLYESQLHPIPGCAGFYYQYTASPTLSRNFSWDAEAGTCSGAWNAAFNIVQVFVKQSQNNDGYSLCCLETTTYNCLTCYIDSGYPDQYSCRSLPSLIPAIHECYEEDSGGNITEQWGCVRGAEVPCGECQCCHQGTYGWAKNGGIKIGT